MSMFHYSCLPILVHNFPLIVIDDPFILLAMSMFHYLVHNFPLIVIDDLVILLAMSNNLVHSSMNYVHNFS